MNWVVSQPLVQILITILGLVGWGTAHLGPQVSWDPPPMKGRRGEGVGPPAADVTLNTAGGTCTRPPTDSTGP